MMNQFVGLYRVVYALFTRRVGVISVTDVNGPSCLVLSRLSFISPVAVSVTSRSSSSDLYSKLKVLYVPIPRTKKPVAFQVILTPGSIHRRSTSPSSFKFRAGR